MPTPTNNPSPPTTRRTPVGPAEIYHQELGHGPPVVLLHGLAASGRWWHRNLAALSRSFRLYVVDLPGFGASRPGGAFELDRMADRLAAWMDAVSLPRASVLAHSMGGYIALRLAAARPDRVDRLVLVAPAALPPRARCLRAVGGLAGFFAHAPVGFLPVLLTDLVRTGPFTLLNATYQLITSDLQCDLARVAAPTLLVWGTLDTLVPRSVGQALSQQLPNARLVTLPRAGHNAMWDAAHAFNHLTLDFLTPAPRAPHQLPAATHAQPIALQAT